MVCRPATQFCCGCSTEFGVKFILFLNFLQNSFLIAVAFCAIILKLDGLAYSADMTLVIVWNGFALAGMPLIIMAYIGVIYKHEIPVRIYWYYQIVCVLVDTIFVIRNLVIEGPCDHLPTHMGREIQAFACGLARMATSSVVIFLEGIMIYFTFIVMSYLEDVAEGGNTPDLRDLAANKEAMRRKRATATVGDAYGFILGSSGDFVPLTEKHGGADGYGAHTQSGLSGFGNSRRIFGGKRHVMDFPPEL
mmetsp:Transcript_51012/g.110688  ORF Transcript_51012/g.110688 Transcript_51012/m.110688 type:complete len:249 (+) Transcript_51012:84-830(+)